jgi:hypothetical protein
LATLVYKDLALLTAMQDQANGAQRAPQEGKMFTPLQQEFWSPSLTIVGSVPCLAWPELVIQIVPINPATALTQLFSVVGSISDHITWPAPCG